MQAVFTINDMTTDIKSAIAPPLLSETGMLTSFKFVCIMMLSMIFVVVINKFNLLKRHEVDGKCSNAFEK